MTPDPSSPPPDPRPDDVGGLLRRDLLKRGVFGLGGMALLSLLADEGLLAPPARAGLAPFPPRPADAADPLAPRAPHFPARAKRCIFLFMFGGPSQMDLFDHKPELNRRHGQTVSLERRRKDVRDQVLLGTQRSFRRHGETGQWCSDAFPNIARHMDELCVVKSLYTDSFAHGSALLQMNSGNIAQGHPSLGSWLGYGLGTPNRDLPAFVVMHDPRGGPISGAANWSSGYMPAAYQGTLFRATGDPLLDMTPAPDGSARSRMSREMERTHLDALNALNAQHLALRGDDRTDTSELAARIANYELAYRMQMSAPEALDLSAEDERTKEMYALYDPAPDHRLAVGPAVFGRQCLIARRLLERGVRFVQIFHGGGHQQQTWDAHHGVEENLAIHAPEVDKPIAALLTDLKRRGLLEDTLVIWGGEFGRQPTSQQASQFQIAHADGRDHNPKGFTMWLAGAGITPGSYGETDELGAEAVVDRHHVRELHASVLHLMGLDRHLLSYPYGGLDRRLVGPAETPLIERLLV